MTPTSNRFYADMRTIDRYSDALERSSFRDAPDDWTVIVADITGSTKAVLEGQYKTVNMIGAACITAAVSVYDEMAIAYVFGGDGATLIMPPDAVASVCTALCALQRRSQQVFGLELRIGVVPVGDLKRKGCDVRVAKLELSPGNMLALFSGGGFSLADKLIKSPLTGSKYAMESRGNSTSLDLSRLSCRWQPLASSKGKMIALLITAHGANEQEKSKVYTRTLNAIGQAIGELPLHAPANDHSLVFSWPPKGTALESRMSEGGLKPKKILRTLVQSAFQWAGHKWDLTFGDYNAPAYKQGLKESTDYRRFDDMIRLVLDCSFEDVSVLQKALDELENHQLITYGLHTAPNALMTCLLFDLPSSRRIHFIDVDEGGFTLAARQMKAKMKETGLLF